MRLFWVDTETFSECDLKARGTHAYAEHGSTEITVFQYSYDDDEPEVFDCTLPGEAGKARAVLHRAAGSPDVVLVAHSSHFDRTLLRNCWGIDVPVERWQDTMIQAMAHGLPGSLDKIGAILGLEQDQAKDKRGRQLIQLFCKPQARTGKRCTRETHPAEWSEFLGYSRQDIVAMRAIARKLPSWNYRADHPELALWHLDQRINDRGFAVDLELARAAIDAVAIEQARLKAEVHELTDGEVSSPSKRDQLLVHILMEYGVTLPDFKADTLRRRMEDPELPEPVKLLLAIRLEATKTSTAKYRAVVNAASADGRLRNTLQFGGAQRTMRWAGRMLQPQNLPRGTMPQEQVDIGIQALKQGAATLVFDNVMELTANTIRGCIIAPPDKKLVVADLSNIEGRGLAYLAGEEWKVQAFRDVDAGHGHDLYKLAYARAFGIDPKGVTKGQRQIGKVMELGLGYEGGVAAFLTFAAVYNMDLGELADAVHTAAPKESIAAAYGMWEWATRKRRTLGLERNVYVACEVLKASWRAAHPAVTALWSNVQDMVTRAITRPGEVFRYRQLAAQCTGAWLRVRLPSGRYLCYLTPKVEDGQITYAGVNQYTRQWARIKTYGGKLSENLVQAWARDVLAHNMPAIDASGYEIVLTVHDEILTETPDSPEFNADTLGDMMASPPPWAADCPLAAAGFETTRYRKD